MVDLGGNHVAENQSAPQLLRRLLIRLETMLHRTSRLLLRRLLIRLETLLQRTSRLLRRLQPQLGLVLSSNRLPLIRLRPIFIRLEAKTTMTAASSAPWGIASSLPMLQMTLPLISPLQSQQSERQRFAGYHHQPLAPPLRGGNSSGSGSEASMGPPSTSGTANQPPFHHHYPTLPDPMI